MDSLLHGQKYFALSQNPEKIKSRTPKISNDSKSRKNPNLEFVRKIKDLHDFLWYLRRVLRIRKYFFRQYTRFVDSTSHYLPDVN